MSLPGKLCIGILEEDNPLRSYYRFKPLLIDEGGRYIPYADPDAYPDEGCIRIVPDKNESYYFKARMRQNGLFCVVDLREHPSDSDKIRPNKNYRPGSEETNSCIVYSDVVLSPAPDMIFQVLPVESTETVLPPLNTEKVLLRQGDTLLPEYHTWEAIEDSGSMVVLRKTSALCPVDEIQVFDLPGFREETVSFAILPASRMESVCQVPERPSRHGDEKHAAEPPRAAEPQLETPLPTALPNESLIANVENAPVASASPETEPEVPTSEADSATIEVDTAETPTPAEDKPWIYHDASFAAPPANRRMSRTEQLLAAQAGLNPRRGRSLQELIDEKWVHSRMNQLGMPVSPVATGAPVRSPVDEAVEAVEKVWNQPQLRRQLLESLNHAESLEDALQAQRDAVRQSSINRELNVLEAQRLELLGELERLKTGNRQVREQLKQVILNDEAKALADVTGKTQAAKAELLKFQQQAEDARVAAQDAQALLDQLAGDELEKKIRDIALTRRVTQRLDQLAAASDGLVRPADAEKIDIEAFILRFESALSALGWEYSRFMAANLCVCLALSPVLLLSGAPGSGKTQTAHLLAEALGFVTENRWVVCAPGKLPLGRDARITELKRFPDAPAALLLDDANLVPPADLLRGMYPLPGDDWRLLVTLQDAHSGHPVCAAALDRGFMVRLSVPESLPWQPAEAHKPASESLISPAALFETLPQRELPPDITARMEALRRDLAALKVSISRRALNDSWRYCAAMLALLDETADGMEILDYAIAQRVLPTILASAPGPALAEIRAAIADLPHSTALLDQPLPIEI